MARKAFFLEDHAVHEVNPTPLRGGRVISMLVVLQEVCRLDLVPVEPGPYVVLAKGDMESVHPWGGQTVSFKVRLDVLGMGPLSANLGTDETTYARWKSIGYAGDEPPPRTFSLMVGATVPIEGGAGASESGEPPSFPTDPPRAVLSAQGTWDTDARARISNVRICALPAEDIVVTSLP